jgi:hypothetical protein
VSDRVLTPFGDQPFVETDGRLTMYALNYLQRLSNFVGSPQSTSSGSSSGQTVQEQISALTETVNNIVGQISSLPPQESAPVLGTLLRLRALLLGPPAHRPPLPPPPSAPAVSRRVPTPPQAPQGILYLANGARVFDGYGAPNTVVYGSIGDLYLRRDGGTSTTLYVKEAGNNTDAGWVAK